MLSGGSSLAPGGVVSPCCDLSPFLTYQLKSPQMPQEAGAVALSLVPNGLGCSGLTATWNPTSQRKN